MKSSSHAAVHVAPAFVRKRRFSSSPRLIAAAIVGISSGTPVFAAPPCSPLAQISPAGQTVLESDTAVKLNGQPSKDVTSFLWQQISGPAVTLSNANAAQPTFSAPAVGAEGATLVFTLTVTGCSPAKTSSAQTIINVTNVHENQPPVASASVSPSMIYSGNEVILDAGNSYDPDGDALTYAWEQVDGPAVTLSNANTKTASFLAPAAPYPHGTALKFKLTVSDGTLTGSTESIVNVLWQNVPPVALVACPASVDEGSVFTLHGDEFAGQPLSIDPDDGIASYSWSQTLGGPVAELPADMTTAAITAKAPFLTSPLDVMSFKLVVTDVGGLAAAAECDVVVKDITPPVATPTQSPNANAAGWNNTNVDINWNWQDAGKGIDVSKCTATSSTAGEGAPLNVDATCSDLSGNEGVASYAVYVDKTGPAIAWSSGIAHGDSFYWGAVPAAPTCTATDALSGPESCSVSGYSTAIGVHTLTAVAYDKAGNQTVETRSYTVKAWELKGFYQPVDMNGVLNTVKNGATVPLKFEVFAASELSNVTTTIKGFNVVRTTCDTLQTDDVEFVTTGGTSLRYDATAGQFIQNWQTPKVPGACYLVTMTTQDGSSISAHFKLK